MQIYSYSILILLLRINGFAHFFCIFFTILHMLNLFLNFDNNFQCFGRIVERRYIYRYIGICPIIEKNINIGRRLPQIIGVLKELLVKLSLLKMTGDLSKIYTPRLYTRKVPVCMVSGKHFCCIPFLYFAIVFLFLSHVDPYGGGPALSLSCLLHQEIPAQKDSAYHPPIPYHTIPALL